VNRYLLDTNVVSELRKPKPHGAVIAWFTALNANQIFLSAITIGELQAGAERVRKQNSAKAAEIEAWIGQLAESFQILPMDAVCFREWARLMEGKPDHLFEDAMIAASARIHHLVLATRNERDFVQWELRIVNPFK
jgi:predicted nucleic acid-binding protein